MNLLLHGLDAPQIDPGNSLRFKPTDIGERDRVDVILTNPPFGGEEEKGIQGNFPEDKQTAETALLFLQLIMQKLKKIGSSPCDDRAAQRAVPITKSTPHPCPLPVRSGEGAPSSTAPSKENYNMLIQPRKSPGKKLRFNMLKSVHHYSRLVLTFGVAAFLAACSGSKRSEPEAADSTQSTNSGSAVRLTAQPAPNRTNETDEPASAGKKATIVTLTDANFSDSVLKSPIPVLVEFRAELASGSKMLAPVFDELSREYAGRVKFGRINAIEHEALNAEYGVREVPTLLMFKGGQVIGKLDGLKNKNDYISFLEKHLSTGSK